MPAKILTTRGIIGDILWQIESSPMDDWLDAISAVYKSNQAIETFPVLGAVPSLKQRVGKAEIDKLSLNEVKVENKIYHAGIEIPEDWFLEDKTNHVEIRVRELTERARQHWPHLASILLNTGHTLKSYDGKNFFANNHRQDQSGIQSNDISVSLGGLGVTPSGSVASPSSVAMAAVIFKGIEQILSFKDSKGEPMNQGATEFWVLVPVNLLGVAMQAQMNPTLDNGQTNILFSNEQFTIKVRPNQRLTDTDKIFVFRKNLTVPTIVNQYSDLTKKDPSDEVPTRQIQIPNSAGLHLITADRDSHYFFEHQAVAFYLRAKRESALYHWQNAVRVQLTA